jgi:AcrR family transcriptional regulator
MPRVPSRRALHRFSPRKLPRQRRSQVVFERIISTAKALFEQEGFAYVSTNRIAARANISIGSLYQYFGNCESIALAVYEEAASRAVTSMKRKALQILGLPLDQSIPKNIEWAFDVFEKDRYALLQLINEIPDLRGVAQPFSVDSLLHHSTQLFFEHHFPDLDRATLARKAYVIDKCVIGVISRYLDERPDVLSRSAVIAEVTAMIQGYVATLYTESARRDAVP